MPSSILRAVIVDDEPIARGILAEGLAEIEGVRVVGEAADGEQAIALVRSVQPEVVFLDVQMPGCDGFGVVRRLKPLNPAIVFVTAFDEHAIRAFETGALDYLLKPASQDRLRAAVDRIRLQQRDKASTSGPTPASHATGSSQGRRRVIGRLGDDYYVLDLNEVIAFRADGEIVWIITAQKRYLASCTLCELTERLQGSQFRRIHRNALINVDHIRKMSILSSQRWLVTMVNDLEMIVSKRQAHTIREVLHS